MRGVYYRTEKDGTPLATPELRISATNNRTVYYDNQNAKEAALQNDEIKEGSIVLTGYADGESEVVIKQEPDWENAETLTVAQLATGYVCPSDGIVVGWFRTDTSSNTEINMKINGVIVSRGWQGSATNNWDGNVQCPVTSGDTVKVDGRSASQLIAALHFVPFKTVAEPLTLPVNVMNNPSLPDYSRAVAISSLPYTAPKDGMIIGNCTRTTNGITSLFINGLVCARCDMNGASYSSADLQLPVSENDTLTADNSNIGVYLHFVPFKN